MPGLLPLYLRHEPASHYPGEGPPPPNARDVVAYRDPDCLNFAGRWPWWQSRRPRKSDKAVTFNCHRWRTVWLQPATSAGPRPTYQTAPNGLVLTYRGAS